MRNFVILFLLMSSLFGAKPLQAQSFDKLLPYPQSLIPRDGEFQITSGTRFYANATPRDKEIFTEQLSAVGQQITYTSKQKKAAIQLLIVPDLSAGADSYELQVTPKSVIIKSPTARGLFYAIQTLRQLAVNKGESLVIPSVDISDYARFEYRGLHLDVSRHFYPVSFIKKHLNALAHYKMNTFHWHLTDGAGWRLQLKQYPELTRKAAWRKSPDWRIWWNGDRKYATEGEPDAFGGYYTQEDVKDVLDYASKRFITVIPEIEMPGHSEEVLAVYPGLSCTGQPYKHGEFCAGNDSVFTFLENVLDEVMTL
ncbi:MAG: beta-N-acetylhexosaminidase, partial [Bacteroidales bacterium]